jgi:RNase adaptor protein for sRNA GlmZ degradation
MWGISMDNEQREKRLAELASVSDTLKELKLKKLWLQAEQEPIVTDYKEVRYKHLVALEHETDERLKAVCASEERKREELEHRLRLDPQAKTLALRLHQNSREIQEADIEIENLKDKKLVYLTSLGLPFPQDIMDIISCEMEEDDENQDEE